MQIGSRRVVRDHIKDRTTIQPKPDEGVNQIVLRKRFLDTGIPVSSGQNNLGRLNRPTSQPSRMYSLQPVRNLRNVAPQYPLRESRRVLRRRRQGTVRLRHHLDLRTEMSLVHGSRLGMIVVGENDSYGAKDQRNPGSSRLNCRLTAIVE